MSAFTDKVLRELGDQYETFSQQHDEVQMAFITHPFQSAIAGEFAHQGFLRRFSMLKHCIERIFTTIPPDFEGLPSKDALYNTSMALHTFVINAFGCVDNLAWILVKELPIIRDDGRELPRRDIGLRQFNVAVREAISEEFRTYLESIDDWFGYLESYRHSLAHRIPLYIAPFMITDDDRPEYDRLEREKTQASLDGNYDAWGNLDAEQKQLGFFRPIMSHSLNEPINHVFFHPQTLADAKNVAEISNHVLGELAT